MLLFRFTERLIIDTNNFTGTIPDNFADMSALREFRAYHNNLAGTFPGSICQLKTDHDLEFLAIDCKEVEGCDCCDECL